MCRSSSEQRIWVLKDTQVIGNSEVLGSSSDSHGCHTHPTFLCTAPWSEGCSGVSVVSTRAVSSKRDEPARRPLDFVGVPVEVDYKSGKGQHRTLTGGKVQSGSGCGNNGNGAHRGFQRRRTRRGRAPAAGAVMPRWNAFFASVTRTLDRS